VLSGKPCSHVFFTTSFMGRTDLFLLAIDGILYALLVVQPGVFDQRLPDRALAGLRIEPK
jgi:hypothetical protein